MDGSEWQYGPRLGMPEAGGSLRADGLRAGRAAGGGSEAGSEHHDRGRGEGGSYEWCKAVCGPLVALREASFASVVFGTAVRSSIVLECTRVLCTAVCPHTTTQTYSEYTGIKSGIFDQPDLFDPKWTRHFLQYARRAHARISSSRHEPACMVDRHA
jgi:hypothetical protein